MFFIGIIDNDLAFPCGDDSDQQGNLMNSITGMNYATQILYSLQQLLGFIY
jgi:hypothetical protein